MARLLRGFARTGTPTRPGPLSSVSRIITVVTFIETVPDCELLVRQLIFAVSLG
jgi:hypothetical protein